MRNRMLGWSGSAVMALSLSCLALEHAQARPVESTSKVKKVMLYNKIGGWTSVNSIAEVKAAFVKLAADKGFELVQVTDDANLTPEYLRQFQVIVWNNNTNGGTSVPSTAARQAILDYVDQGGGWLLLHAAADHAGSWPGLAEALGTVFTMRGPSGPAQVLVDDAAASHRELKWMVEGFPTSFELNDTWLSFENSVRALPGVTVVATARPVAGSPNVVVPMGDGGEDHPYIWAREVGQGRMIYNGIGSKLSDIMAQQDSLVPRLYWENLRYAAGDYQNGCTNSASPGYDAAARVNVEAMCSGVGVREAAAGPDLVLSHGGARIRLAAPGGALRARLRDLRGALVWERDLPAGTAEFALDGAVRPGVYHIEFRGAGGTIQRRVALP